jgi:hypothetical protein
MGGACSTYWGEKRCIQVFSGKTRGGGHLKDPGIDWRIMLKWILEKCDGRGMDWIDLAQDWYSWWWALVNVVLNLQIP